MTKLIADDVENLASDQASLKAASKLLNPAKWPLRETDGDYIWAECQGSGANPYRAIFDLRDYGSKCTCPSRKFPCKHCLALGLIYVNAPDEFTHGSVPEWGADWIGRRRKTPAKSAKATDDATFKPAKSLKEALEGEVEKEADPQRKAAQEAARIKRAEATKTAQMAGLLELENWIFDNLALGLPQVLSDLSDRFRTIAARMADAKAASLSGRLDEIPERIMMLPNALRGDALIEELGKLVLLSRAAQTEPQPLGLHRAISNAENREVILENPTTQRHQATWQVIASHTRNRKDGLISFSTWLLSLGKEPRFAQLLDFSPAARGKQGAGFSVGQVFEGEICYYPSPFPLRAVIAERTTAKDLPEWGLPQLNVRTQLSQALLAEPWLQDIPVLLGAGRIGMAGNGGLFWQSKTGEQIPLIQTALSSVASGVELFATTALMQHGRLLLLASNTPLGVLFHDE